MLKMNSSINYDKGTNYPSNPDSGLGLEGDEDFHDDFYDDPGHDELNGNAGDNLLNGGPGRDKLYGGLGVDTFVLENGQGRDKIYRFVAGTDNIKLEGGLAFGDLNILQKGSSTLIEVAATGEDLAILSRVNATDINNSSVFV